MVARAKLSLKKVTYPIKLTKNSIDRAFKIPLNELKTKVT